MGEYKAEYRRVELRAGGVRTLGGRTSYLRKQCYDELLMFHRELLDNVNQTHQPWLGERKTNSSE